MAEKEKNSKTPIYFAVSICLLFFIFALMIYNFMSSTRERITDQNRQYLSDAASQTVKRVDEVFESAAHSIRMVSLLYELQLDTPEFDYRLLNEMSGPTPFEYIRFVGTDGMSWSGEGVSVDCSDREYFLDGVKGNSGICYISSSRFVDRPIINFYTPLYYKGEIIGVVCGVYTSEQLSEKLDASFFEKASSLCVCLPDGTIAAVSKNESEFSDRDTHAPIFSNGALTKEASEQVAKAMREERPLSFGYKGKSGNGIAYLAPLKYGDLLLVQTFPSDVGKALTDRANRDALALEVSLIVVFLIYIALIIAYYIHRSHVLSREKEDLGRIVDSVKQLYLRFVIFNLEEDSYKYLEKGNITSLGIPAEGTYTGWFEAIRKKNESDPRYWGSMDDMTVEHLRSALTKENWFVHREYLNSVDHWERLSLIKLDMESDRTDLILGAVEDITDSKMREEENRKALETAFHAAEAASRAKSDFLSRMSHDIRTPMNAIIGLTAIMGAHLDDSERIVDCLTKITSSSKHLLGLINEVLDMSKIESGKFALSETEFSLPSMVDDMLSIVQTTVKAKHQELTVKLNDIVHEDVIGDDLRLRQVFVNILSNAVKYTNEGGHITLEISELPSKQPLVGEYMFVFEDDGIGMPPEFLKRIFVPFERADDERVSGTQGTGLGMSIAHSIIRLMGGDISVESEEGKGSRFTVRISLKLQDADEEALDCLVGLPVLVADDEQTACETTCLMLGELGMRGEWVLTGKEAVEKVVEHRDNGNDFFAVILDWKMPGMDGVETARAIRREVGDGVPIIILSAYDWSEIENEARAAGVNSFIGKPLFKSRLRGVFSVLISEVPVSPQDTLGAVKERSFGGKRVLLAEDNDLNQEIAKEILEMTGLTVDVAENGKVALDMFADAPEFYYDIVLMDIQMPIMNGYDSTRAIRALPRADAPKVPIVAMTANTFNEDIQASLDAGMVQHIGKPLDMDQLMSVLDKWLT